MKGNIVKTQLVTQFKLKLLPEEDQMPKSTKHRRETGIFCRRNELQALDLAITAFMSSLAFISMIGKGYSV